MCRSLKSVNNKIHLTSIGSYQTVFNNYVVMNKRNNKTETGTTQRQKKNCFTLENFR